MTPQALQYRIGMAEPASLPATPQLSIIVPTFNEVQNAGLLVAALAAALPDIAWEVIFVDDDSPDGTAAAARRLGEHDGRVRCIRRIGRRGLSGACIEGMLASSAPVVATMDGDLQHDETLLPRMLGEIANGADIVVASRFAARAAADGGLSASRLRSSRAATWATQRLLGIDISDPLSGFFMLRRAAFEDLAPRLSTQGFKILLDILASSRGELASSQGGLKTAEVPLLFRPRQHGQSKLDELVVFEFLSLLLAKATNDRVSLRFIVFGLVGALGLVVHLAVLKAGLATGLRFELAQMSAAYVAMTSNFFLNNVLTYRDRRLRGWQLLTGLLSFYVVCSVGMVANVGVGQLLHEQDAVWWLAGVAGAVMGAVFNYVATSAFTWRSR